MDKPPSKSGPDLIAQSYKRLKAGKPVTAGHAGHDKGPFWAVREIEYNGHRIAIRTQYEIRVDDKPLGGHIYVDNTSKVSTHALPNYSFSSAIDLVKKMVDAFPDNFTKESLQSRSVRKRRG